MRRVEYNTRQGPVCHLIYEPCEADQMKIPYRDYRDGLDQGGWILTDDGKVVQVLKLGRTATGRRWIRTCTGTFMIDDPTTVVDTAPRESRFTFSGKLRTESHQRVDERQRQFGRFVGQGVDIMQAYSMVYPKASRQQYIREKALMLLQKDEVKQAMANELGDKLQALGITPEYILQRFKELADNADSDSVSLASLNSLAKITGIMDKQKNERQGNVYLGLSQDLLDRIKNDTVAVRSDDVSTEPGYIDMSANADFGEPECVEDSMD